MMLLGVLFAALVTFLALYDISPPKDADMLPEPFAVERARANPMAPFLAALQEDKFTSLPQLPAIMLAAPSTPVEEAIDFLNAHTASFTALDELLKTDPGSWHWPDDPVRQVENMGPGNPLSVSLTMGNACLLLARSRKDSGNTASTLHPLIQNLRFGRHLQSLPAPMIHYLVGSSLQQKSLDTLAAILPFIPTSSADLRALQEVLRSVEPVPHDYQQTMKHEYAFTKASVDLMKDPKKRKAALAAIKTVDPQALVLPDWAFVFSKTHLSFQERLEWNRPVHQALNFGFLNGFSIATQLEERGGRPDSLFFWLRPNPVGRIYERLSQRTYLTLLGRSITTIARLRQADIMLALRQYELAHSHLPESLDELVPAYLPAVPQDPFDETPMKWNLRRKALHSVGDDLKDGGGILNRDLPLRFQRDIITSYWWTGEGSSK